MRAVAVVAVLTPALGIAATTTTFASCRRRCCGR
jgi:hypothetical protein